jgi:hypothetical protein
LKFLERNETLNGFFIDQESGDDPDAHFPGILGGLDDKGSVLVLVEALAKGSHIQVQLLGKTVQLLSSERFSGIVVKQQVMVGPELPLILGAMSRLGSYNGRLAMENKVNEDHFHQSGINVFLLDLTGRLFSETRGIRSMELGEHNHDQFGPERTLARQIFGNRKFR